MSDRPEGAGTQSRRRALLILLAAVVLLAAVYFLFLSGGDGVDDFESGLPPQPSPTASPSVPAGDDDDEPGEVDEDFDGRDPFQPLVAADEPGPAPDGGEEPGDSEVTTGGEDGEEARRVTLLDIFREDGERFATVEVDDEQFTVAEGETFADSFRLLDLTSKCGTFVFGDERFTLCLGQEVLK